MEITKYFLLKSRKDFIVKFTNIYESLLSIVKEKNSQAFVDMFSFNLEFTDEEIKYASYKEFISNKEKIDFRKFRNVSGYIKFKENKQTHNRLLKLFFRVDQLSNNTNLQISIESSSVELIKKSFNIMIYLLPGSCIYRYNQNSENIQKIKKGIQSSISILENLNEYQLRMISPLRDEKELQDFIFPILKSHFKDLEYEFHLPRFGNIEYKPDFGVPSIKLLIECKFLRNKADLKKVQKEIHDDIIGYLKISKQYKSLIVLIYNSKNIPVSDKFIKDIKKIKGIKDLIIIPGIYPS